MEFGVILIFIIIVIMNSEQKRRKNAIRLKKKRGKKMTNELIKNAVGKTCDITTGSWDTGFSKVKIIEVVDNWIKVEKKGKLSLINADHIQTIKFL